MCRTPARPAEAGHDRAQTDPRIATISEGKDTDDAAKEMARGDR